MNTYCSYYISLALAMIITGIAQTISIANSQRSGGAETNCNFTKPILLKSTSRYGLLGNDEFDTLVCGHLVTQRQEIFGGTLTVAYLRIIKAADRRFLFAIQQEIERGNGINFIQDNHYYFNLGCIEGGKITGTEHDIRTPYITESVQTSILKSTFKHPVALILSFGKHTGSGCDCCNLAHRIRLYKPVL